MPDPPATESKNILPFIRSLHLRPAYVLSCRPSDCRTAVDDRSSDILKMAAFAKQLYEMRPSSTKLQLINVPFHSSHSVFQRVCVSVCVHTMHACRHDTFMVVFVIP